MVERKPEDAIYCKRTVMRQMYPYEEILSHQWPRRV